MMKIMTLQKLCTRLRIPLKDVESGAVSEEREIYLKKLFYENESEFYFLLRKEPEGYRIALYLYMKWAAEVYDSYCCDGISEQVYYDTFSDMTIWYHQCLSQTGIPGIKQYEWIALHIRREIYRLGRLQYQLSSLKKEIQLKKKYFLKGTPVLEIHISEGRPLELEKVMTSFYEAKAFFSSKIIYRYELFYCESWLLSPALKQLLPKDSNILKFQNLFTVVDEKPSLQAEERVFGFASNDVRSYPENTHLQKTLKSYLLNGGKVGEAYGIILPKELYE